MATSASGLPRVFFLGRRSDTKLRSDLHWPTPRLKFTTSIASALQLFFCSCLNRILTFWFSALAGSGSFSQSSASLLGSWEYISTSQLVRALEISVKALLDMTHQHCPGFIMVTVGMVVGMVSLKATGKRMSPVRSRILPLSILIMKDPALWWQNLSLSEGLWPHQLVGWNQNVPLHFDLEKHHCSRLAMSFFSV